MKKQQWQDWANLALGLWVIVSPWTIAHSMASPQNPLGVHVSVMWDFHVIGILVTILALAALSAYSEWMEWLNIVLGACLFISTWVFGFSTSAGLKWNAYIVGALIAAFALGSLTGGPQPKKLAR